MKKILLAAAIVLSPLVVQAGDAEAGKAKSALCAACHGANGISILDGYPNLAGQNETYLAASLKAYRAGERSGGNSALMTPMAAGLSDTDIEDLAAYFAEM